jgi:serine/threonine protein kinase
MFLGGGYDEGVDLWAVGITLYQLITGRTPFESEYLSTTIENITKCELHFDNQVW